MRTLPPAAALLAALLILGGLSVSPRGGVFVSAAQAQETADVAGMRRTAERCLAATQRAGTPAEACIGQGADRCLLEAGEDTTAARVQCRAAEIQAWSWLEADAFIALKDRLSPEQRTRLQAARVVWMAHYDADCGVWLDIYAGGSLGREMVGACRLDLIGRRAIDMRRRARAAAGD